MVSVRRGLKAKVETFMQLDGFMNFKSCRNWNSIVWFDCLKTSRWSVLKFEWQAKWKLMKPNGAISDLFMLQYRLDLHKFCYRFVFISHCSIIKIYGGLIAQSKYYKNHIWVIYKSVNYLRGFKSLRETRDGDLLAFIVFEANFPFQL